MAAALLGAPLGAQQASTSESDALLARAFEARGGEARARAAGVVHLAGRLRFDGVDDVYELEAYVESLASGPRGFVSYRLGALFRVLLLTPKGGHERIETGEYRTVEGVELARLRGEVTTLLLAARFPADGSWLASTSTRSLRRGIDGVTVELRDDGSLASALVPDASAGLRRFSGRLESGGLVFPSRVEAFEGEARDWSLEIVRALPKSFVVDALFEPPSGSGEARLVLGPSVDPHQLPPSLEPGTPFLRVLIEERFETIAVDPAIGIPTAAELPDLGLRLLGSRTCGPEEVLRVRLDASGRIVALERWQPPSSEEPESRPRASATAGASPLTVSVLVRLPLDPASLRRAIEQQDALARARGFVLEAAPLLSIPRPDRDASRQARPASGPARAETRLTLLELTRRVTGPLAPPR